MNSNIYNIEGIECIYTVTVEDDEGEDHQNGMPVELYGRVLLPGEAPAKVEHPDEQLDDEQATQAGRHAVQQRHPSHLGLVGETIHLCLSVSALNNSQQGHLQSVDHMPSSLFTY